MFIELHAQSAFSFLEGAEHPEVFAAEAARLDMPAVALIDRDGVYGAARLARAAAHAGVKPIVGSEITLIDGARLPLLVEDREGYQNLCRLITRMKLGAAKGAAETALDDLEPYAAGLVCLTGARAVRSRSGSRPATAPAPARSWPGSWRSSGARTASSRSSVISSASRKRSSRAW